MTSTAQTRALGLVQHWSTHQLYGLTLASDYPFDNRLGHGTGAPDLTFTCVDRPRSTYSRREPELLWRHPTVMEDGSPVSSMYRYVDHHVFHYHHVADFHLFDDRIECVPDEKEFAYLIEIRFLGSMLALWLELQGTLAFHASAVVIDDQAVAFTSFNHGGKTSLAASLMEQGRPLLTDDLLAVDAVDGRWLGLPGYPQMRMWPQQAESFVGEADSLDLVHPLFTKRRVPVGDGSFGSFARGARPLGRIYFLERDETMDEGAISIEPVSSLSSIAQLLKHSFASELMVPAGLQAQRLRRLAQLLAVVPTLRLVHSTRWDQLPLLREAVLEDVTRPP